MIVGQAAPVITWANPAGITYGMALSAVQLNATASVPGAFVYTPAAGSIPAAGTDTLSVTFTPTDTTNYSTATTTVQIVVSQSAPVITWAPPANITYGTALVRYAVECDCLCTWRSFVYTPAAGTVPAAGTDTLSVTFTPTDTTNYSTVTKTVSLTVTQAAPVITWAPPAGIAYGTALSSTQLNASASVPGALVYAPAAGTIPAAGTDTLSVTFTPTDTTNYTTITKTVQITVSQVTPTITWASPAPITYGTALTTVQLNATASVPGTLVYTPAAGNIPAAGTVNLTVTFTPDGHDRLRDGNEDRSTYCQSGHSGHHLEHARPDHLRNGAIRHSTGCDDLRSRHTDLHSGCGGDPSSRVEYTLGYLYPNRYHQQFQRDKDCATRGQPGNADHHLGHSGRYYLRDSALFSPTQCFRIRSRHTCVHASYR